MFTNLITDNYQDSLSFLITGQNRTIANSLRRVLLNDIPSFGFCYEPKNTIKIIKNTTEMNDQLLSHRLSMIPVSIPNIYANTNIDEFSFIIDVNTISQHKFNGSITTDDFKIKYKNEFIPSSKDFFIRDKKFDTPILIAKFPNNDKIHTIKIESKLASGTARIHSCFRTISVCIAQPASEFQQSFYLESLGQKPPHTLITEGIFILIHKIKSIFQKISTCRKNYNERKFITIYNVGLLDTVVITLIKEQSVKSKKFKTLFDSTNKQIIIQSLDTTSHLWKQQTNEYITNIIKNIHIELNKFLQNWINRASS